MDVDEIVEDDVVVLAPKGRLNTYTSPLLDKNLQAIIARKQSLLVLDLGGVDYLTSAALRVLLATSRRLRPLSGRLVLCCLNEGVRKVFAISGFERDFPILATREDAVEAVRNPHTQTLGAPGKATRRPAGLSALLDALGIEKAAKTAAPDIDRGAADAAIVMEALGSARAER